MDTLEQSLDGNKMSISIKRPNGLSQKWSEASAELKCSNCGSTDLDSDTNGSGFFIACPDCPNYYNGLMSDHLTYYPSEEARVIVPDHFERVNPRYS